MGVVGGEVLRWRNPVSPESILARADEMSWLNSWIAADRFQTSSVTLPVVAQLRQFLAEGVYVVFETENSVRRAPVARIPRGYPVHDVDPPQVCPGCLKPRPQRVGGVVLRRKEEHVTGCAWGTIYGPAASLRYHGSNAGRDLALA